MSTPALAQLAAVLRDDKAALDSRFRSLFALKGLASSSPEQTKEVIDIISKAFDDNDSALLKHELAYVLGQIQSEDAIDCLESVLKDEAEHPMVRHEAAEALGAISSVRSLPILRHYLKDSNVSVRETCDLALKKIEYDHAPSSSTSSAKINGNKENESEGSALARAKAQFSGESQTDSDEDDQVDSAFLPIDPAPAHSQKTHTLLSSIPLYEAQLSAGDSLPLFDRYRAMFSLRNAVHAGRRKSQGPSLSPSQRKQYEELALSAVLALANGLSDKSALFRHEICFVFGELAHPGCVESMVKVLSDDKEEEMVRHEAAEALGAVVEEATESQDANEQKVDIVMKTLQQWANNAQAPRVVRESCLVALDEMAYNNDPTQFQPVEVA